MQAHFVFSGITGVGECAARSFPINLFLMSHEVLDQTPVGVKNTLGKRHGSKLCREWPPSKKCVLCCMCETW